MEGKKIAFTQVLTYILEALVLNLSVLVFFTTFFFCLNILRAKCCRANDFLLHYTTLLYLSDSFS